MDKDLEEFGEKLKKVKDGEGIDYEPSQGIDLSQYEEKIEEKPVKKNKKSVVSEEEQEELIQTKDYSKLVEANPELKNDLDYMLIIQKIQEGQKITEQEKKFKEEYELAIQKQKQIEDEYTTKLQEEKEKLSEEEKAKIEEEYKKFKEQHPEKVVAIDTSKEVSLDGGANFLKVALTWAKLIKSRKKGGKIFVKVSRPKKVSFEYTNQDIRFVEFWSKNERGEPVKEITRVNQYNYTFNGTSIPVIFAIQGFAESYDFFSEFRKDLTSEFVTGLVLDGYVAGYKDGTVIRDKNAKNNPFAMLEPWMPLIIIAGFLIMGYIMYTMYGEFVEMVELTKQLATDVAAIKASAGTLVVQ